MSTIWQNFVYIGEIGSMIEEDGLTGQVVFTMIAS